MVQMYGTASAGAYAALCISVAHDHAVKYMVTNHFSHS